MILDIYKKHLEHNKTFVKKRYFIYTLEDLKRRFSPL